MKPILFNTEMVQAIEEDRKTQTRRPIKSKTGYFQVCWRQGDPDNKWIYEADENEMMLDSMVNSPYKVGDILYVRETWADTWTPDGIKGYAYKAKGTPNKFPYWGNESLSKHEVWRPSIHMPKEAARIFLEVTDIRVERVQDITTDTAMTEGVKAFTKDFKLFKYSVSDAFQWSDAAKSSVGCFENLWNSMYGNWDDNPWVWVIKFKLKEIKKG